MKAPRIGIVLAVSASRGQRGKNRRIDERLEHPLKGRGCLSRPTITTAGGLRVGNTIRVDAKDPGAFPDCQKLAEVEEEGDPGNDELMDGLV